MDVVSSFAVLASINVGVDAFLSVCADVTGSGVSVFSDGGWQADSNSELAVISKDNSVFCINFNLR